jgi:hypothetical protein
LKASPALPARICWAMVRRPRTRGGEVREGTADVVELVVIDEMAPVDAVASEGFAIKQQPEDHEEDEELRGA